MTRLFNDPARFRDDMVDGFVAAYARYVSRVSGASGVLRASGPVPGKVSVIVGGGSGHYPAFCGLVGPGFADGAVIGDIFTSPSAEQAYLVGKALDGGAGVLFSYGNYNGDVMNFGLAESRLRGEGIDCRTVVVTDDVASADTVERRRGIAGDFCVFKAAGAAADRGEAIAEVERIARKANDRTRTLGAAFAGCTFPGKTEPLFTVDPAKMELGLGIHGEPGVATTERLTATELAELLVERLLVERPADADGRAGVILNGLGSTKYEELFVVWKAVSARLAAAGIEVVSPEVGELVTSLDMAGCSLTLHWLDDELAELWDAPADTPAFRRGDVSGMAPRPVAPSRETQAASGTATASAAAHAGAAPAT
ncbi:dihydroxyacetone kinase family protein, partial [Haloechinothrix salitolerans]